MDLQFVFGNPIKKPKKSVKKKSVVKAKKSSNNKKVVETKKKDEEVLVAKKKKARKATKKTKKVAKKATRKSSKKVAKKVAKKTSRKRRAKRSKAVKALVSIVKAGSKKKSKATKKTRKSSKRRTVKKAKKSFKPNVRVTLSGKAKTGKRRSVSVKYPRSLTVKKVEAVKASLNDSKFVLPNKKKFKKARKQISRKMKRLSKGIQSLKAKSIAGRAKVKTLKEAMKLDGVKRIKTVRKFTNPFGGKMDITKYLGHDMKDLAGLAAGGAIYGAVNGVTAKYAKPVHDILVKVPVVGTALPSLLAGVALIVLADKVKAAAPAKILGQGLVGASIVGMGVNAAQMVPALNTLKGLGSADFGSLQHEASLMGPDFGKADFGHAGQMGGIDYTMSGIDYTMSGIDYTMSGDEDFAGVPEGLGSGQMG